MNQLDFWFRELAQLIGVKQPIKYHPEGDAWNHTMMVLDIMKYVTDKDYAGIKLQALNQEYLMFACMCHDLGKYTATEVVNGKITSIGHDIKGIEPSIHLLDRIAHNNDLKKYVINMVELHMRPNMYVQTGASTKKLNKMFDDSIDTQGLLLLAKADHLGRWGATEDEYKEFENKLIEALDRYTNIMSKPYVTGKDLVANGFKPNSHFKEILDYSHKLRLAGVNKENALRQTISFANKTLK